MGRLSSDCDKTPFLAEGDEDDAVVIPPAASPDPANSVVDPAVVDKLRWAEPVSRGALPCVLVLTGVVAVVDPGAVDVTESTSGIVGGGEVVVGAGLVVVLVTTVDMVVGATVVVVVVEVGGAAVVEVDPPAWSGWW